MTTTKSSPIPVKRPRKTATATATALATASLYTYERDTEAFQQIVRIIDANISKLRKAGVLFARPGYEQVGGLMTTRPAVVVTVANKRNVTPAQQLPPTLGGFPVDVRQATFLERIRAEDPGRYAQIVSSGSDQYSVASPEQERIVATGESNVGLLDAAFASRTPKEHLDYAAPAEIPLKVIEAPMALTCHVSPDAGWLQLKGFFNQIRSKLVTGMYDFTSAHILQDLESALRLANASFTLTLDDPPAENSTADQPDPDTVSSLQNSLGSNFHEAWALVRSNRMVDKWIFPTAYHIKVAVSDSARTWLSSGNWNNSNQPDIDPWNDRTAADDVAKNSDRDWHVIFDSPEISQLFEAYLSNDFQVASSAEAKAAAAPSSLQELAQLTDAEVQALDAEMAVAALAPRQYFEPLRIPQAGTQVIRVQPLLTPDKGSYAPHVLQLLQQAQERLFIQLQYVHPSESSDDQDFIDLVNTVIERQKNNVEVRIIVSQWQLMQGWLDRFIQTGIDPNSVRIQHGVHNKGFVIDSKIVMLGSQNWSAQGVLQNRDASVIIYNDQAGQYYENIFLHDWENLAQQSSVIASPRTRRGVGPATATTAATTLAAPAVIPILRTARQKTRFVMANRRAGKFGDARLVSRFAMDKTVSLLSSGADILADLRPPDEYARRVTVFEADPSEVQYKVSDPNVIVEPEILHWKDTIPPADLLPVPREFSAAAMAADLTLALTVTGGGTPLPNATVILYSKTLNGIEKATAVTDNSGRTQFPISSTSTPSAILVTPAGNFWTMVKRAPGLNETIDCPPLPTGGPIGWWHEMLGITALDLSAGKGVKVGVADTGCGPNACLAHVTDTGAFVGGTTLPSPAGLDVDLHGTHVCGIIGARPISNGQYAGIAPGADLYIGRIFPGPETGANQGDIANAIDALSKGQSVDLINLSLGSTLPSQIEHDAIIDAYERGTVCVCAAGNDARAVNWPAAFPECVAVSALGLLGWGPPGSLAETRLPTTSGFVGRDNYYFANFSSFGPQLLCAGPGVGIISTVPERFGLSAPYLAMDGTSMASPAVCGLFAVLLADSQAYRQTPDRNRARSDLAKTILRRSCVDIGLPLQYQGLGVPRK